MSSAANKHLIARPLADSETLHSVLQTLAIDTNGKPRAGQWYVLLDARQQANPQQAFAHPLLNATENPRPTIINLYDDLGELGLKAQGPRLALLSPKVEALEQHPADESLLDASYLFSSATLEQLAQHLKHLREISLPDKSQALFRFQDSRVTNALMPLASAAQAGTWLGCATCWACVDACGHLVALRASATTNSTAQLSLTNQQIKAVDRALLPHEILAQTAEADSSVLHGLSACARLKRARTLIARAERQGLKLDSDISLFCVLGMQLPDDFELEEPFASAIKRSQRSGSSFSEALNQAKPAHWDAWNKRLSETP